MKTTIFSRSTSLGRSTIDAAGLEQEMNAWLAAHPSITITDIQHSALGNVWTYTQLVIAIYYRETSG